MVIYIDFTDFNLACPKDGYPLPRIDQMVDATWGHDLPSFMDAFFDYNQILIALKYEEKTTFIIDQRLLCYKIMSFGLKNACAIYQCLVIRSLKTRSGGI